MADPPPGMGAVLSYDEIYRILIGIGASDLEADQLTAIALAESGGRTTTHNPGTAAIPEDSWGMFQFNLNAHPYITEDAAQDPVTSANYALNMYRQQGPTPWSVTHEQHRGTSRDYRQYLRDPGASTDQGGPPVITPPDVYGSELTTTGGADAGGAPVDWPKQEDYLGYDTWMEATARMATTFGIAGIQMPAGVPSWATAAWHAAQEDAAGLDPSQIALNLAQVAKINEELRQGKILLPYDLDKIKQDIRLAEPFGSEKVLRTSEGQRGYNDYWAGGPPTAKGTDYLAGYNLAKAGDEPRQTAVSTYLDTVVAEIGQEIELRGQNITAAVEEIRGKIDTFDTASRAFEGIQKYTIPFDSKYVPGFEPDGFATSIGLQPWEASPISYDPFQMGIDLLASSPRPTGFKEPSLPGAYDPDMFKKAIDFYRGMI